MARSAVIVAVQARLTAHWTHCPVFGINIEGDTPQDGSVFLELQFPIATARQMDLASTRFREEGVIRLIVNAQRGDGLTDGLMMADQLADLFRAKKFDGVQTGAPSSPVIDDRNDNGLYYPVSIAVPYHFDFTDPSGFYG